MLACRHQLFVPNGFIVINSLQNKKALSTVY